MNFWQKKILGKENGVLIQEKKFGSESIYRNE